MVRRPGSALFGLEEAVVNALTEVSSDFHISRPL